jgi:hypothetical protein
MPEMRSGSKARAGPEIKGPRSYRPWRLLKFKADAC